MNETEDDDPPEREWRSCRLCSGEELLPDEQHVCPYAKHESMSEVDELDLLEALNAAPLDTWNGPSSPWAVDEFTIRGWRIAVFFDGPDFGAWDYVDYVVTPGGVRYDSWPDVGERALPMSVANWKPAKMGPVECVISKMKRITESFRELAVRFS